ncbi:class I SAM-dependent methyltransferase [Sulfitobacter albidus]|uniref:Class I SAM-dependent methyltransferase n=1 Tax=Sulfitobacter albidus TaxID=2829501 RepID=A0A975JG41_9RHOB|nr:class I SAM-dependent methyltransferase [Sulfitobacter albidus]QUJ77818.1 class I SAM-dependent methyltransferase [Sulfitobacter albidus]
MDTEAERAAFFKLHSDLPREGPGVAEDVGWAADLIDLPRHAEIADAACGPGGDIAALLAAAPEGHVTALDLHAGFVAQARARWGGDDRVTTLKADMTRIKNRHDLIWCAGAVYFIGIETALRGWREALKPGGAVAFSEVCWFTDTPCERPRAFWKSYPAMTDRAGIDARIHAAGYEIIGQRQLADAAWEAYFGPLDARIAALRPGADAALAAVLDEAEEEAACWRNHRDEWGYLLSVVRPA